MTPRAPLPRRPSYSWRKLMQSQDERLAVQCASFVRGRAFARRSRVVAWCGGCHVHVAGRLPRIRSAAYYLTSDRVHVDAMGRAEHPRLAERLLRAPMAAEAPHVGRHRLHSVAPACVRSGCSGVREPRGRACVYFKNMRKNTYVRRRGRSAASLCVSPVTGAGPLRSSSRRPCPRPPRVAARRPAARSRARCQPPVSVRV